MSFTVYNPTPKTVILSDLGIEIGKHKFLNLERVRDRSDLSSSKDLADAIRTNRLAVMNKETQFTPHGKKVTKLVPESGDSIKRLKAKAVEKPPVVIKSKKKKQNNAIDTDAIGDKVAASLAKTMGPLVKALQEGISELKESGRNQGSAATNSGEELDVSNLSQIDLQKIAEFHQDSIRKMSDEIESQSKSTKEKISLDEKNSISDIADEL